MFIPPSLWLLVVGSFTANAYGLGPRPDARKNFFRIQLFAVSIRKCYDAPLRFHCRLDARRMDALSPHDSSTVDRELLARVAKGNQEAFDRLYEQTSSLLYTLVLPIVANPRDAADPLQQGELALWRRAPNIHPDGSRSGTKSREFPTRRPGGRRATGREAEPVRAGRARPGRGPRDGAAPGGRVPVVQHPAWAIPERRDHAPLRAAAPDAPARTQVQNHDRTLRTRRLHHHQPERGEARVQGAYPDCAAEPGIATCLLLDPADPA